MARRPAPQKKDSNFEDNLRYTPSLVVGADDATSESGTRAHAASAVAIPPDRYKNANKKVDLANAKVTDLLAKMAKHARKKNGIGQVAEQTSTST